MEHKVSQEQFEEYREVQKSGEYNMFDPRAQDMTSLDRNEWIYIIQNYDELLKTYEG